MSNHITEVIDILRRGEFYGAGDYTSKSQRVKTRWSQLGED